jgi:hypothetical protein
MYGLSLHEMEAMGPEERARLGVEEMYQRTLIYQANKDNLDNLDTA